MTTTDVEVIQSPMEICWQFAYEIDSEKLKTLYSQGQAVLQWDAEQAISTGARRSIRRGR